LWRNRQTEVCLILMLKPRNHHGDFEAQITKPELSILRPKPGNHSPPWFWGSTKISIAGFETKLRETVATSFEAKLEKTVATGFEVKPLETVATSFEVKLVKTVATGFEAKPLETIATGFEGKPVKTIRVVLRSNHSQTVNLGFEAQPRNPRSKSSRARCRSHTVPPNLSTAPPPSNWHVRPFPVICTRSPTPATILIDARHAAPTTCTPRDKQTWFSKRNKGKRKIK
jgi:hypothetical protein